jgi:hypothetical protein
MKKLVLLFTAVFLSGIGYAQFTFGPQIGFASSNLTLNVDSITSDAKSNFVVGAFARFGKKIYLQPEINWGTSGSVFQSPSFNNASPVTQTINIKSIQVPVSLGWKIINLKVVNFRIYGGVTPSFITDINVNTENGDGAEYLISQDDFKNVLWNYQVGAGVDVLFLALNVSWMGGMTDVFANDIQMNGKTLSSKSNILQVTLGWKIL